jgi:hypothetical protein
VRRIATGILAALLCVAQAPTDCQHAVADESVRRKILALYDSSHEPEIAESRLHRFAEMPLNHLGFILRYHDVNTPLPPIETLQDFAGVISWFADPVRSPAQYLVWARDAVERGKKYVVLADPGADTASGYTPAVNAFLGRVGITFAGKYVDSTYGTTVKVRDASMGFEHDPESDLPPYAITALSAPDVTPLLEVVVPQRYGRLRSTLVAVGPRGGYAAFGYEFFHERRGAERGQWILNPFDFFRRAFGGAEAPIPDVTTVSGRRIYFSHVDGDGWNNMAIVEAWRGKLSSKVMLEELIKPFPDLPVTVGLIGGDVDVRLGGSPAAQTIARQIFALPQVEVGSHTYTHPFNWSFFETYDRERELKQAAPAAQERGLMPYLRTFTSAFGASHQHGKNAFVSGISDPPRAFIRDPFRLDQEIAGSLDVASRLAPAGKRATVLLWSGSTRPFEAAIRATREAGVVNINGGDSRFDASYPSIAYVPPIGRVVGKERQIYAVNSNENTYTNGWTEHYAGQQQLSQTFANTELPRRLKGMNLYYHTYSAERQASLDTLKTFLAEASRARITPITTSRYAAMADGFFTTTITSVGHDAWSIADRGALETVRFDTAHGKTIDLARSHGVLGHTRHASSLYVALDPAEPVALVVLARAEDGDDHTATPSLAESRWRVARLERNACGFRYIAEGFGAGDFSWENLPQRATYRISSLVQGREAWSIEVATDDAGKLNYTIPIAAFEPVEVSVVCAAQTGGQ